MKFKNKDHEKFFLKMVLDSGCRGDREREALFYVLGINPDTRDHVHELYDFKKRWIKEEGLEKGWQTGGSLRITRLAFNLYNNFTGEPGEESAYTPHSLFDGQTRWMLEGVRILTGEGA